MKQHLARAHDFHPKVDDNLHELYFSQVVCEYSQTIKGNVEKGFALTYKKLLSIPHKQKHACEVCNMPISLKGAKHHFLAKHSFDCSIIKEQLDLVKPSYQQYFEDKRGEDIFEHHKILNGGAFELGKSR
ncbi:hypothetical protein MADA3029_740173 [Vibrio nigripulchritudo MADA3029]|uniref:hypothetical protein n=1 Tax=Vibrio nigripulchritudo TaxID=28173 RepID=UPI00021C1F1D|nr:hypothetical protein [Vibrio nigripulchritudo]EGU60460.1 hypothetical protein VINI7043_25317 [Vibrio nigripulchritudo ATCC 27043]CCN49264.1 hypothetical protein VIBNIMADA3020_710106 [Vibrio nigripulchritudo MADA3020]CCN54248.1 hypothetical protein VIBNIMADA3021_510174 [Vibrio nigripulchritudo MADA3021]CCN61319.1 hypothetical protein MADA3029_740173 [Vibrio nigripulchritudo MADA3029]